LVEDPMGKAVIKTDLSTQSFYFNNDSVGRIVLKGDYYTASNKLDMFIDSRNPLYDFGGTLWLHLADSATNQIEANIDLRNERISVLNDYLTGILDNLDGFANGQLKIRGKLNSPQLLGDIKLSAARVKVGYTQCTYDIDTATLRLGPNYINFGTITLRDGKNRKGTLEGIMYHKFFDSLSFNMRMRTEGMQVLNTTAKDNDLFFGDAVAKASFDLTGPLSNLRMRIIGITNDSSKIVIANKTGKESGEADFLRFKTYGVEMVQQLDTANTNIHISLDLTATPLCKIDVVMDELTGDMISASGNGNLKITAGTTDPTVMRGRFQIEKGSYNYSFQTLIKKPFELQGGEASYIEWTGDPYDATLNVKARYKATNVSMRDLMGSEQGRTILDQSAQNYKGDVYVNALVQGLLSSPRLTFGIEFPQGSPMLNNVSAQAMLRQIEADNSEMLRQVTYLIVFKQFAPYKEGVGTRNPGADLAVNTLSDLLSSQMGKMLTNLVQEITGDRSLSVDISTEVYNSTSLVGGNVNTTTTGYDRVNFNFMLNRSYFNNRVVVNLGSDFDLNVRNTTAAGFQFLPDVSIEFILTTNRRLRAILFKKDNLDFAGRRNRAGVSLSYRKEFDKLFSSDREEGLIFIRKDDKPDQ
jgi:TamB, inner membrane protein subunit of TAM complex